MQIASDLQKSIKFKFEDDEEEYRQAEMAEYIHLMSQSVSRPIVEFTPLPKPRPEPEQIKKYTYGMNDITRQELINRQHQKQMEEQERLRIKREQERQQEITRKQKEQRDREEAQRKRKQREQEERLAKIQREKQEEIKRQKEKEAELERQKKIEQEKIENQKRQQQREKQQEEKRKADMEAAEKAEKQEKYSRKQKSLKESPNVLLLTMATRFANSIKQSKPIELDVTNIQTVRRIIFNILENTDDIHDQLQQLSEQQKNSHMAKLWSFIVMVLINGAKKDGFEQIPPISLEAEVYKNSINVFILVVNILRVRGFERLWLYHVGKTIQLLDFIFKRKQQLKTYRDLDLIKKGYMVIKPQFQSTYVSRLDQLTYFLFGLLTMDPYLAFRQIIERTKNERNGVGHRVEMLNKPWDYSIFFVLVQQIRKTPFTHVKPFCYQNIFSMLYLQLRQALKGNREMNKFSALYKQLVRDSQIFYKEFNKSEQCNMLQDADDDLFEGTNLHSRIQSIVMRIHKSRQAISEITSVEKLEDYSILYFFTDFQKQ